MREQRRVETVAKTNQRREIDKIAKREQRKGETVAETNQRRQKDKQRKAIVRSNNSESARLKKFRESVRYGPIFTCTVCEQDMFINGVSIIDQVLVTGLKIYKCFYHCALDITQYHFSFNKSTYTHAAISCPFKSLPASF